MYKTSCLCGIMSRDKYLDLYMGLYGRMIHSGFLDFNILKPKQQIMGIFEEVLFTEKYFCFKNVPGVLKF